MHKLWYWGWLAVALAVALSAFGPRLWAQTTNQAGLVIVHGDGRLVSRCITFGEEQISGYELLQRANLDLNVAVDGIGAAICRIDGEGCNYPQQSCFCGTEGDSYRYWSYWQLRDEGWQYANLGATNTQVQGGAVQGWLWGEGANNTVAPPPLVTFAEICMPPTATSTATATVIPTVIPTVTTAATPTPTPPATATPAPTETATALPTALPTATLTWTPLPLPTATGTSGATATALPPAPQITVFMIEPATVTTGEAATLYWQVQNGQQIILRTAEGESLVGPVGNLRVQPTQRTTYSLVVRNDRGEVTATVELAVSPAVAQAVAPVEQVTAAAPTQSLATPVPTATAALPALPIAPPATVIVAPPVTPPPSNPGVAISVAVALATQPVLRAIPLITPVPVAAVTDPSGLRLALMPLLGGVAVVLFVPLVIIALGALLWFMRNNR